MEKRFLSRSAGVLILTRENQGQREVLMQLRGNTEAMAYQWHPVAGHVEADETVRQTICREAKEEVGIIIHPDDLRFLCVEQYRPGKKKNFYSFYFQTDKYSGQIHDCEPDKAIGVKWMSVSDLPETLNPVCRAVIENIDTPLYYLEYGFDE